MNEHQVIVNLSGDALRRALDRADEQDVSLSELFEILILGGEAADLRMAPTRQMNAAPDASSTPDRPRTPNKTHGQLSFLTNRLSPVKVATGVLAALSSEGSWPALGDLQVQAADAARTLGLGLRKEDQRAGRRGAARRWTGYPVGEDADAARGRYIASFTAVAKDDALHGPLIVLGLGESTDRGRIALTEAGYELAQAPSPLDEAGEHTLSEPEIEIFRRQLQAAPDEMAAIEEFLGAVRHVAGIQTELDALLATRHADWSANRASAERAAMLGRLGELGMLRVEGRGSSARIELMETRGFEKGDADEREAA